MTILKIGIVIIGYFIIIIISCFISFITKIVIQNFIICFRIRIRVRYLRFQVCVGKIFEYAIHRF